VTCERARANASQPAAVAASSAQGPQDRDEGAQAGEVSERDREEVTEVFMRLELAADYYYYAILNASSTTPRHADMARLERRGGWRDMTHIDSEREAGPGAAQRDPNGGNVRSGVRVWQDAIGSMPAVTLGPSNESGAEEGGGGRSPEEEEEEEKEEVELYLPEEVGEWAGRLEEAHLETLLQGSMSRLNSTWFLQGLQDELLEAGVAVVRAEWEMAPVLCMRADASALCNQTLLLATLQDRELLLALAWGEFPTIDLLRDPFATFTFFLASLVASLVLYASIRCQQARMAKMKAGVAAMDWGNGGGVGDEVKLLRSRRRLDFVEDGGL